MLWPTVIFEGYEFLIVLVVLFRMSFDFASRKEGAKIMRQLTVEDELTEKCKQFCFAVRYKSFFTLLSFLTGFMLSFAKREILSGRLLTLDSSTW